MKSLKISLFITIIASLIVSLSACNSNEPTDSKNTLTTVSASIFPIYDIAKQIGGDKIQAHLLIQPGESPHTFEPTVTTKKNISNSNTVFVVGHLLDNWIENLVDDKSKVVVVDKNISLMRYEDDDHDEHEKDHASHDNHDDHDKDHDDHDKDHDDDHDKDHDDHAGHAHGEFDPHYWLSPSNGIQIAFNIKEELKRLDSNNSDYYENNYKIFKSSIENLRDQLLDQSRTIQNAPFVTMHAAWEYYGNAFNLNIAGSFEPEAAEEPTPRYLKELQHTIEKENVKVIFSEPQLSISSLSAFISDNGLGIGILDPLGGSEDNDSYQKILQYNMDVLREKLEE